jgi:hypothetical protein
MQWSAPCPSPLLQCTYSTLSPLLCVSFQFLVYSVVCFVLFCGVGVSLPRGLCWFILGVAGGIPCDAWCSPVGLLMSPKQVWSLCLARQEPSCFLSVTWCGEAFHGLRIQGVKVSFFLVLYFHQVWHQHLSKIFDLQSSCVCFCTLVTILNPQVKALRVQHSYNLLDGSPGCSFLTSAGKMVEAILIITPKHK